MSLRRTCTRAALACPRQYNPVSLKRVRMTEWIEYQFSMWKKVSPWPKIWASWSVSIPRRCLAYRRPPRRCSNLLRTVSIIGYADHGRTSRLIRQGLGEEAPQVSSITRFFGRQCQSICRPTWYGSDAIIVARGQAWSILWPHCTGERALAAALLAELFIRVFS